MKRWIGVLCALLVSLSTMAHAGPAEGTYFSSGLTNTTPDPAAYGTVVRPLKNYTDGCEDVLSDVCKVEERYSVIPVGGTDAPISADQLYKSGSGYVRGIECYGTDSAAVAGTIALRDSTVAGSGAILWSRTILAADYSIHGVKAELQTPFSVGLFLDFTTTTDMSCIVRYRG